MDIPWFSFTTKLTKDTKGLDIFDNKLRALRDLRGQKFVFPFWLPFHGVRSLVVDVSPQETRKNLQNDAWIVSLDPAWVSLL
jgi:hypothetical protein